MKITIKANEKITSAIIKELERNGENCGTKTHEISGDIYAVEINFECSYLWSDLEFWLENDGGEYKDHLCLNVSKREKMQTHK